MIARGNRLFVYTNDGALKAYDVEARNRRHAARARLGGPSQRRQIHTFNQLTRSRDALVADLSGLTRDRQYGQGRLDETAFIVIDTGGISGGRGHRCGNGEPIDGGYLRGGCGTAVGGWPRRAAPWR